MLSWVESQLERDADTMQPRESGGSERASSSRGLLSASVSQRRSGLVDLQPWQLKYSELKMQRPLGEGSFGKVRDWRVLVLCCVLASYMLQQAFYT